MGWRVEDALALARQQREQWAYQSENVPSYQSEISGGGLLVF